MTDARRCSPDVARKSSPQRKPTRWWRKLRNELDARSTEAGRARPRRAVTRVPNRHWRAVRAAILVMGDSGLRREEAASARRERRSYDEERRSGVRRCPSRMRTRCQLDR